MADTCWDKVEDAVKAVLDPLTTPGAPLEGWTVLGQQSTDVALDVEGPSVSIWTVAIAMDQSQEQGQSIHTQTVEVEFVSGHAPAGTLGRKNKAAMAHAHAAIAADRSFGGMLQDIQEIDAAPARIEGKDTNGTSLQYQVEFFTPRDDWFTIVGQGAVPFY